VITSMVALSGACLVDNPGYQATSGGSSSMTAEGSTSGAGEITGLDGGVVGTVGDESEGSTGVIGTSLIVSDSLTLSGGDDSGGLSDTGDVSGGDSEGTSEGGTDASTSAGSGDSGDSGGSMMATLRHYKDGECSGAYYCSFPGGLPAPAQTWSIECFVSPFEPPFSATRASVRVRGLHGAPGVDLRFYRRVGGVIEVMPFATRDVGVVASTGWKTFEFEPVGVDVSEFCVGAVGKNEATQLVVGIDTTPPDLGASYFQMGAQGKGCDVNAGLLESIMKVKSASWCLSVDVVK